MIQEQDVTTPTTIKLVVMKDGKVAGRASLFFIQNELYDEPYGLLEDVFVEEAFRRQGIATTLVKAIVAKAKKTGCYKILANYNHPNTYLEDMYGKFGFEPAKKGVLELRFT